MQSQTIPTALGVTAVMALVLANAFFVAAEFALVGARKTRLDELAQAGDRKARLARLIQGGFDWLPAAAGTIATHGVAVSVAFIIITVLHIILGELVPKALALIYPEAIGSWVAAPLMGFAWVMAGPIALLNGTANALLKL